MKLIGIGDAVVDYYKDQGMIYPGGSVVNVAVAARRNGAEQSAYLGILGTDLAGDHLIRSMNEEGVDVSRVRRVEGPTGEAMVTLNEEGDRIFIGTNKDTRVTSMVSLTLNPEDVAYIRNYDIVHSCISIHRGFEKELPKIGGKILSFDFSSQDYWTMKDVEEVCPYLSYAFFSGSGMEPSEIGELIDYVHRLGVGVVGVTRGDKPAIFSEHGVSFVQNPSPARVVDTMGAGDSFIGAFLTKYAATKDMARSLQKAADYAAAVCSYYGAFGRGLELPSLG